jgi:hypothetical protein
MLNEPPQNEGVLLLFLLKPLKAFRRGTRLHLGE